MHAAQPFVTGPLRFKNRMVVAPFKSATAEPGGTVSRPMLELAARLAGGGAAMVITEPTAVHPGGREHPRQLAIHDEGFIAGLGRLVNTIHRRAAIACCHLNHAGRAANPKASGGPPLAPSPTTCPSTGQKAEVLTEERIGEILEAYRTAASHAWWAGYDAIEVQAGHGYLVAQFLSPRINRRTDGWGGTAENRLRFAREVLAAVHEGMNGELPIILRVSGSEMVDGGLEAKDLAPLLELAERSGVAAIHVGMGSACESPPWYYAHMALPMKPQEDALATIRELTSLPLIAAGRMGEPERMERILDGGLADLVALARPLVADPDLPRKVVEGRTGEIVLCGSCLQGCLARVKQGQPISCIVNPEAGHIHPVHPTGQSLEVMVVGGGPAGIQAAITLAERGHRVSLWEAGDRLGGQFRLAPRAPGKDRMRLPLESLLRKLEHADVEVHLGSPVDVDTVVREDPGAVVIATGARPVTPGIPVTGSIPVLTGFDLFDGDPPVGSRALVVGGGMIGMEAAELLAERGVEVVVVEMLEEVARDMEPVTRKLLLGRLERLPVEVHTGTTVESVGPEGVTVKTTGGSTEVLPPVDSVVYAVGTRPENALAAELERRGYRVQVVGDASRPGQVLQAVHTAWEAAAAL